MVEEQSTEERIKEAATKIFTLHGLEGARMQAIADEAGINKAMLHYYFRSKEDLFNLILDEKISKIYVAVSCWMDDRLSLKEKVYKFVEEEITVISEFPVLPLFLLMEARKNPSLIQEKLSKIPIDQFRSQFKKMIQLEIEKGNIREVTMDELFTNVMSLCVYPIIAAPMLRYVLNQSEKKYTAMIEQRKKEVAELVIRDLQIKH